MEEYKDYLTKRLPKARNDKQRRYLFALKRKKFRSYIIAGKMRYEHTAKNNEK